MAGRTHILLFMILGVGLFFGPPMAQCQTTTTSGRPKTIFDDFDKPDPGQQKKPPNKPEEPKPEEPKPEATKPVEPSRSDAGKAPGPDETDRTAVAAELPKSATARDAIAAHERNVLNATKVFDSGVAKSRDEMVRALTVAMNKAMERKDLDEANRLKAYIDKPNAPGQPFPEKRAKSFRDQCDELSRNLAGTTWQYAEGHRGNSGAKIAFDKNGTVVYAGKVRKTWTWAPVDGRSIILQYGGGLSDILIFDEGLTGYKQAGFFRPGDGWEGKRLMP